MPETTQLDQRSIALRRTIIDILHAAGRGHVGAALSLVEILRVLYDDVLRLKPEEPEWAARDRCILSKGHGCLALYPLLAEKGFFEEAHLWNFCKPGAILGGHPERRKIPGVEATTGSLGHGLSIGLGRALHARMTRAEWRVFVVMGDGECNEGSVWEAAMCASKHRLDNLVAVIDYNKQQSYGTTKLVLELEPFAEKWQSFGFSVREVNGHDVAALRAAFASIPAETGHPTAMICHTVKGKGLPVAERNLAWHHKSRLSDQEVQALLESLETN